jgi:lipid A 4'-phosphatase
VAQPSPDRRRRIEAAALGALALLALALFASGTVDIAAARWFYRAGAADHWPLARQLPWTLLYRAASCLTAALVIAALAALTASLRPARRSGRRAALLVLLTMVTGPGLLANALFKDHWQHPRPRELVQFGGPLHYVPTPLRGAQGGASLPCGHCAVGFVYSAGWWIWRRRRRGWAAASLAGGLLLGALLGAGRMAAGAHFLSDIVFAALLVFGVLHALHYYVLPADSAAPVAPRALQRHAHWVIPAVASLGGVAMLVALFVTPHGTRLSERVALAPPAGAARTLEVEADVADVSLELVDAPASELAIEGELHGFGMPASRLAARLEALPPPLDGLRYRIEARGWLTDVDGLARLVVPASAFAQLTVVVHRGNIEVIDTTCAGVVARQRVRLELEAARGHVQLRAQPPRARCATDRASAGA